MDHCSNCGKKFNEDELYEVINHDADEIQYVCSRCLEFYTKCDQCGLYRPDDSVTYLPETDLHVCNFCQEPENDIEVTELIGDREEEAWLD